MGIIPHISNVLLEPLALGLWIISPSLVSGWHSAPVFSRQSMVASGRISVFWCLCLRSSHLEIWTLLSRPLRWLHSFYSGYLFTVVGGFWTNFQNFLRERELGSWGRFTSCSSGYFCLAAWRSVHSRSIVCLDFPRSLHFESQHHVHEPLDQSQDHHRHVRWLRRPRR